MKLTAEARWQALRRFIAAEKRWYARHPQESVPSWADERLRAIYVLGEVQTQMSWLSQRRGAQSPANPARR